MRQAHKIGSKLCAYNTRNARDHFLTESVAAQLAKGQGFAPPRSIPSRAPQAAAETVPVSAPFGFDVAVFAGSWAVRP